MTKNTAPTEPWEHRTVRRIGAALKRARGTKSATWLAERTAELGLPISATIISKLDSGHRGSVLSVPELLVLAAAVDVPPALLLFGDGYPGGEVEYLPGRVTSNWQAAQWLSGEAALPGGAPNAGTELVAAVRQYIEASRNLADADQWVEAGAEHGETEDLVRSVLNNSVASGKARIEQLQERFKRGIER